MPRQARDKRKYNRRKTAFRGFLQGLEGNLTDIWGSAYAASLDGTHTILGSEDAWPADVPPPTTAAQRAKIVRFLADRSHGLFVAGQVRHLPAGQGWTQEWCVPHGSVGSPPCAQGWLYSPPGVYQNGGTYACEPITACAWPFRASALSTRRLAIQIQIVPTRSISSEFRYWLPYYVVL